MKCKEESCSFQTDSEYMGNIAEDRNYEGLAKEITDLLIALGEQYSSPGQEHASAKKTYEKPHLMEINQEQYRKFKNIIYFIHTVSDEDNDSVSYNRSEDGMDVSTEWKTSTILLSKGDLSLQTFAKVITMADGLSINITGLDEMSVIFTLKNFMKKLDKGNEDEGT